MIDLEHFRKMADCTALITPDAGARETRDAMLEAAKEIEELRWALAERCAELSGLADIINQTPWMVEHIASESVVAAFAQPDIARQYMDRGIEIGHWRFQELRLFDGTVPQENA